jgi:ADP-ribose pyrophosphatase
VEEETVTERQSARRTVYRGRALVLHVDEVTLADGRPAVREVVEHPGSVVLVPIEAGHLLLVRQYRYAVGDYVLELPAGTLEPGEPPLQAARRELAEETGRAAASFELMARLYPSPGYTSEAMWLYLATGLEAAAGTQDQDESIELEPIPLAEADARARRGDFADMKTVAGILLAGAFRSGKPLG